MTGKEVIKKLKALGVDCRGAVIRNRVVYFSDEEIAIDTDYQGLGIYHYGDGILWLKSPNKKLKLLAEIYF